MQVSGPVFAVDQENVGISVIVIVNESAARTHGFRQPFFPERSAVVREVDSSLRRYVAEVNLLGLACC